MEEEIRKINEKGTITLPKTMRNKAGIGDKASNQ
jgi:bifunctional DNA-binding transcriptional regulator/antitoxin component of YhaV-PrlF toxin-antitoxin module